MSPSPISGAKKAVPTVAFIAGLMGLLVEVSSDPDMMPLGTPYAAFVAAAASLALAVVLASPIVRWLGGDAVLNEVVKPDAALGVATRIFASKMAETARTGMSARDMRIMMGSFAFFPLGGSPRARHVDESSLCKRADRRHVRCRVGSAEASVGQLRGDLPLHAADR